MKLYFFALLLLSINSHTIFANCDITKLLESTNEAENFLKITCPLLKDNIDDAKKHANEIIAAQLAEKIKQRFENISAVEAYYSSVGVDLGKMGSSEMMKSCTISNVSKSISKNSKCSPEKMDYLKKALGGTSKDSLGTVLSQKYSKIRNLDSIANSNRQCPLVSGSTQNQLTFSMDDKARKNIKKYLGTGAFSKLRLMPVFDFVSTDKEDYFKEKFNKGLSDGSNQNENNYVDSFLKNNEYVLDISKNLGKSCDDLFKNVTDYACLDFDPIPSNEDNFKSLVKNDPNNEFQIVSTCHYLDNSRLTQKGLNAKESSSVDNLLTSVNSNLRPSLNFEADNKLKNDVCDLYNCTNPNLSKFPTCSNGKGPISSNDLTTYCNESHCSLTQTQFISFLANFELEQSKFKTAAAATSSKGENSKEAANSDKKSSLSSFNANFLGIEGTLMAEGTPVTPEAVAIKKAEFKEAGLMVEDSTSKSQKANLSESHMQNTLNQAPAITQAALPNPSQVAVNNSLSQNGNYDFHPTPSENTIRSPATSLNEDTNNFIKPVASNSSLKSQNDTADIRHQLDKFIEGLKGSNKEKIQSITDNNLSSTTKRIKDDSGLNDYERNRLEDYRQRLENWDRKLSQRESEISSTEGELKARASKLEANSQGNSQGSSQIAPSQAINGSMSNASADKSGKDNKLLKGQVMATGTDNTEAVVDSADLPKVDREMLIKAGINMKSSFFIKIKYEKKFVEVPVKIFTIEGKEVLVPILDSKNKLLNQTILSSPLFKDYLVIQKSREKERTDYKNALI